jgi:hypothetical protein
MRRIILLNSILLLSAVWAVGQQYGSDSNGETKFNMTVEGCLSDAIGNYTLTDYAGASYQLTGNTEQLKTHDGETVRVTGVVTSIVHVPGAMSEGTTTQPTLSVVSFRRISGVCREPDNIP